MEQLVVERDRVTPNLKAHRTDEQLELYALDRLPESDKALLEEHLLVCVSCREKLDGIGDFAQGMRAAGAQSVSPPAAPTLRPGWRAWLQRPVVSMSLAFALLILVIGIFSIGRTELPPVASLQLTAVRGPMPVTAAAQSYHLLLTDAPQDGGPFRIEVVNAARASVWSGVAAAGPTGAEIDFSRRLSRGDYFVRVNSADGKMLREYGFRVR